MQIGSHSFTFDHVFGSTGTPLPSLFERCVAPLVEGLFHGYNATVLAYGQVQYGSPFHVWGICFTNFLEDDTLSLSMNCYLARNSFLSQLFFNRNFTLEVLRCPLVRLVLNYIRGPRNLRCLHRDVGGSFIANARALESVHRSKFFT